MRRPPPRRSGSTAAVIVKTAGKIRVRSVRQIDPRRVIRGVRYAIDISSPSLAGFWCVRYECANVAISLAAITFAG